MFLALKSGFISTRRNLAFGTFYVEVVVAEFSRVPPGGAGLLVEAIFVSRRLAVSFHCPVVPIRLPIGTRCVFRSSPVLRSRFCSRVESPLEIG